MKNKFFTHGSFRCAKVKVIDMNTADNECRTILEARDERVFGRLEQLCGALLRRIAKNILRSGEDAEEILNDTLFKVWSTIPPKKPDSIAAYAGRIARNLALNRYAPALVRS